MSKPAWRTTIVNLGWVLGDKAFAMVAGLLVFGLIARAFGPQGAGHFSYALAMLQIALGLSLVCSATAVLPRLCSMQAAMAGALANIFTVRMAASLVSLVVMAIFAAATVTDPMRRNVTLVMLLAVPLIEPFAIIAAYWNSRNHNRPNVVARSTGLLVRLIALAAGMALGAPPWLLATTWVLEAALNSAIQWHQLRRALPGRRFARYVRQRRSMVYLRFGARFMVGSWLHVLYTRLDRLLLGERLSSDNFGLYAVAMQLLDVWVQVASLVALSMSTAFLYRLIREGAAMRALLLGAAAMAAIGLLGVLGAWWLGPWMLRIVFGPQFLGSQPYLVAAMAVGVLLFVNQVVTITLATLNRPALIAMLWGVSVLVTALVVVLGVDSVGAMIGPIAMATGLLTGWLTLIVVLLCFRPRADAA
ncbi:hypothetical protein ASF43_29425 [Pseudorhodoferax sp. Leaf267]|nr:hypothetical protein ASF43_29425 [Pseudorhodoferax sp. Leaf267]